MTLLNAVSETQVNTSDAATVGGGSDVQQASRVTALAGGGYVVVFEDESQDTDSATVGPGETRILAQIYGADGTPVGGEFQILGPALQAGDQRVPDVVGHPDGGFIIVGQDFDFATDSDIEMRRFDATGTQIASDPIFTANDETTPTVQVFEDGSYAVIYIADSDAGDPGTDTRDLVVTIYSAANVRLAGSPFVLDTSEIGGDLANPRATLLSNGNIAVTYDEQFSATDTDPQFVVLQANGTLATPVTELSGSAVDENEPAIAALTGGGFVIAYTDSAVDGDGDGIEFVIRDNAGAVVLAQTIANTVTSGDQADPAVVSLSDGGFIITYMNGVSQILGQRFDANGGMVGGVFEVNDGALSDLVVSNDGLTQLADGRVAYSYTTQSAAGNLDIRSGVFEVQAASVELSDIDGIIGTVLNGIDVNDFSGDAVSSAGDINGDGFDDILIGARNGDPGGNDAAGETYVVFGQAGGLGASLDLSSLNGSNGFVLNGIDTGDFSGASVSSAGDINGDGFDDILIGANTADPGGTNGAGETYVVFGQGTGFAASLDLSSLNGSNGFVLNGIDEFDFSGDSISAAGDVNGDGYDDILVGASNATPGTDSEGETYLIYGGPTGISTNFAGGDADQTINGSAFGDTLNGGGGDDTLIGGGGVDAFVGGTGDDLFLLDSADETVTELAGQGTDEVSAEVTISMASGFANVEILTLGGASAIDGTGNNQANVINGNGAANMLTGLNGNDTLHGNGGDDIIFGNNNDDVLNGNLGEDTLFGGAGDDEMNGGGNNDTLFASVGSDTLNGNDGDDFLNSGAQDDTVNGGNGNDEILGRDGNDLLNGGVGNDTLFGGNQDDTLNGGADEDTLIGGAGDDSLNGGDDNDRLFSTFGQDTLRGGSGDDFINGGVGDDTLFGDAGNDTLLGRNDNDVLHGGTDDDTLFGGNGNDTLNGNDDNDVLQGGAGNDALNGNEGNDRLLGNFDNDTLRGGNGNDTVNGGTGSDAMFGDAGTDSLVAGTGNDTLNGGNDNDTLIGELGNDSLIGGSGDDRLLGGSGNDTMNGGSGVDVFVFIGAYGVDVVTDFDLSVDRISLQGVNLITDFADLTANHLSQVGNTAVITIGGNTITLDGIDSSQLTAGDFFF